MKYYKHDKAAFNNLDMYVSNIFDRKINYCVQYYNKNVGFYNTKVQYKRASFFYHNKNPYKNFWLNGEIVGNEKMFKSNKEWRKYIKLLVFL